MPRPSPGPAGTDAEPAEPDAPDEPTEPDADAEAGELDEPDPADFGDLDELELEDPAGFAAEGPGGPGARGPAGEPEEEPPGLWLSWPQVFALLAAVAFLAAAVTWVFTGSDGRSAPGEVDVGFYRDMSTHHEQAVQLSMLQLDRGQDPTVMAFATEILIFQNRELGIMGLRLADWGEDGPRPDTAMAWMGMPTPPDQMPGMATEAQIDALRAAEGTEADRLFLELMAEHHRGGVHMAAYAADHAEDEEVRRLAATMERFQSIEINEMAQTADRLGLGITIERVDVPPEA